MEPTTQAHPSDSSRTRTIRTFQRDASCVTSLDELDLRSAEEFARAVTIASAALPATAADTDEAGGPVFRCARMDAPELVTAGAGGILRLGVDESVLDIVEGYLGEPAAFVEVYLRRDLGNEHQVGIGWWHLDWEDAKVVRMIVYLDDVAVEHGPFEYIPLDQAWRCESLHARASATDDAAVDFDPVRDDDMRAAVPESMWRRFVGPRFSVAFVDAARLYHHAKPARHARQRLALLFMYTTRRPPVFTIMHNPGYQPAGAEFSSRQRAAFFVPHV